MSPSAPRATGPFAMPARRPDGGNPMLDTEGLADFDPVAAAHTAPDPLACDTADPGMDASSDDALAVNTDATPDHGTDGAQDDVDQAPVTEDQAQAEADVAAADEDDQ